MHALIHADPSEEKEWSARGKRQAKPAQTPSDDVPKDQLGLVMILVEGFRWSPRSRYSTGIRPYTPNVCHKERHSSFYLSRSYNWSGSPVHQSCPWTSRPWSEFSSIHCSFWKSSQLFAPNPTNLWFQSTGLLGNGVTESSPRPTSSINFFF